MKEEKFQYGGQAVLEGVMMRGRNYMAVSIRKSDGSIVARTEKIGSLSHKISWLKWPLIRGMLAFVETMILGVKVLFYSANELMDDLEKEEAARKGLTKKRAGLGWGEVLIIIAATFGVLMLFIVVLPDLFTRLVEKAAPDLARHPAQGRSFADRTLLNLIEGLFRLGIFILYVVLVSFIKDIRRVWSYHGAEHKAIFTYEAGEELRTENARVKTTLHPRCGTSFLFYVIIVSYLVFSVIPRPDNMFLRWLTRLPLLLPIAGISYELIKAAGKKQSRFIFRILSLPGLWLQRITTKEPDDQQLEVALRALKEVLTAEAAFDSKVVPVDAKKVESLV
ncbi:MAG: DUF1385 domain-containing protein [Bacillota bacterium]